jgi:hypothetical protein
MFRRKGNVGREQDISGSIRKKDLKLTGEVSIELGD